MYRYPTLPSRFVEGAVFLSEIVAVRAVTFGSSDQRPQGERITIMKKLRSTFGVAVFALAATASIGLASAQDAASEVGVYAGAISGGGSATIGGNFGKAINSRMLAVGEFGYATFGSYNYGYASGIDYSSRGLEFGGNLHYLFPMKSITPYVLGGVGVLRYSSSVSIPGFKVAAAATTAGVNIGGGIRWQAGKNWGVRPELKYLIGNNSYSRFSVGVYYQFGK